MLSFAFRPGVAFLLVAVPRALLAQGMNRRDFYQRVWADLSQAGLMGGVLAGMMTEHGWKSTATTELGVRFLRFIEQPRHPLRDGDLGSRSRRQQEFPRDVRP